MTEDRLTIAAVGQTDVQIIRDFAAPVDRVWKAMTDPALIPQWLGAHWPMTLCRQDFRIGGTLRWEWSDPDGDGRMGLSGRYIEIAAPRRLVHTEIFDEDWTGGEAVVTMDFAEIPGGTRMTMHIRYASREARDAVLRTPMADGMEAGYRMLDAMLAMPAA